MGRLATIVRLALVGATAGMIVMTATPVAAAPVKLTTSTQLIENPKKYDGKIVTFRGEVIGDVMTRGNYAWLSINDDVYQNRSIEEGQKLSGYNSGQAVWAPSYLVNRLSYVGGYTASGDNVEVTGVFNSACAEHGGDMDIHAASLRILRPGRPIGHPLDAGKALAAAMLLAIGGSLVVLNRRAEARRV